MKLFNLLTTIKYFGCKPLFLASWHRVAKKCGLIKRKFPAVPWLQQKLSDQLLPSLHKPDLELAGTFFPVCEVSGDLLNRMGVKEEDILKRADRLRDGDFAYFSKQSVQRSSPVNWHENPFNQALWPADVHWCDLGYFSSQRSDIKLVWEINRFAWAYDLVRAYTVSNDPVYVACFWRLFEDWISQNQPNRGVNWVSGQECALRLMASCFAFFSFRQCPATTPERTERFLLFCAVHAERIEHFIAHAIRQKTNHAMTEATGLYTVGLLFPFFRKAEQWKQLGKKVLEQEAVRQIYSDGAYVQQSMNYHRVMLHAYFWSLRLAELNGDGFSVELRERLEKATDFLYQMQDVKTGRVPNYGANDGALILPVNSCDYLDYRPIVQSMNYLLNRTRRFDAGLWDEDLLWFFGSKSLDTESDASTPAPTRLDTGGYYTIRTTGDLWGMVRCHSYRDRVGHVDMLHVDLWAEGENLLRDCGSYRYFAPDEPEMEQYFKSIWAHNTAVIDNQSPLKQISRFMLIPWPKARCIKFDRQSDECTWEGEHDAYRRAPWNVVHHRKIHAFPERWEIVDTFKGTGLHHIDLRWHLPPSAKMISEVPNECVLSLTPSWQITIQSPLNFQSELIEAGEKGGWESLYYHSKTPIKTLSICTETELPAQFTATVRKGT